MTAIPDPALILTNQFGEKSINAIDPNTAGTGSAIGLSYVVMVPIGFAELNTATSAVALVKGLAIPDNAIIKQAWYEVLTTFADNGTSTDQDSSTISLGLNTNVDLKAAVAISNGANPWDAGIVAGIPVGTAAAMLKLTAARQLHTVWTHGTGNSTALTAGAMNVYMEYVLGT